MIILLINIVILIVGVLISVAFLTLIERKVLGYIQFRKGPNKLGIIGIVQPFRDAIKLFRKEYYLPEKSNFLYYLISPIFSLILSLVIWIILPYSEGLNNFRLRFLLFLSILGIGVYLIIINGWSSNSNYALLGSLRAIVQTLSYEVSLIFLLLCVILLIIDFNLMNLYLYQKRVMFIFFILPIALIIFVSLLAECNRTPFDFAEGERELVSGFNIEYGGREFALIFLAEYRIILVIRIIFVIFFFINRERLRLFFFLKIRIIRFLFVWVRGTLPRFRYDKLIYLTWKIFLPVSLNWFILIICFLWV